MRDGIDVLRLLILGGAVGYALAGRGGAAALLAFLGAITLLARAVNLPRVCNLSLTPAMAQQGFGEVWGLDDRFVRFDDLVRVTLPVVTTALGIAHWGLWEIWEWRSDAWFGTQLSESDDDTDGDLVRGTIGSLAGAALLVVGARFGWGSVRRIPASTPTRRWMPDAAQPRSTRTRPSAKSGRPTKRAMPRPVTPPAPPYSSSRSGPQPRNARSASAVARDSVVPPAVPTTNARTSRTTPPACRKPPPVRVQSPATAAATPRQAASRTPA